MDGANRQGIAGLRVEARSHATTGSVVTGEQGYFTITFEQLRYPKLFKSPEVIFTFDVFDGDTLIKTTQEPVPRDRKGSRFEIDIVLDATISPGRPWVTANSFDELMAHEAEIVGRIANTPNGGNLFMIHPFQLLQDIGVALSEQAIADILTTVPELSALSLIPYIALQQSTEPQNIQYRLSGLFPRRAQ